MAVADTVVVELRANTQNYLAGVQKAEATFLKSMGAIDTSADSAGASLDAMGNRGAAGLNKIAAAAPRAANSLRAVNANTANLGAQFQDIGVQLAAGTSPFTILAQQLPQLTQGGGSLNGVMAALRTTVSSLISPLGLATTAFVLLTSAAIPYFVELISSGEQSEEVLKKNAQLVQALADRYGDALPAIKAYADELKRAADEQDRLRGTALLIDRQFADLAISAQKFSEALEQSSTFGFLNRDQQLLKLGFIELQNAAEDFRDEQKRGGDTAEEVARVQAALASIMSNEAVQGSDVLKAAVNELIATYENFISVASQAASAAASLGGLPGRQGRLQPEALSDDAFNARFGSRYAKPTADYFPKPKKDGGSKGKTDAEREAEATAKLIDQLTHELSLIGLTNEERLVANNLRRLGANATDEQRQQVVELTKAIYAQTEAEKRAKESAQELANIGKEALGGFIQDIRDGVSATDALKNALDRVLDNLLEMGLNALFSGGTGGAGGFLKNLFGGFRASGGPVSAGRAYMVGERGPELFMPGRAGSIIPNTPKMTGKTSSGPSSVFNFNVDATGADPAAIARLGEQLREVKRSIQSTVDGRITVRNTRGMRPAA